MELASRGRRKHLDGGHGHLPIPPPLQSVADRQWLYGKSIVRKLALVQPHFFHLSLCRKKRNIIAVGRWDDLLYKRPYLLMATLEQALAHAPHGGGDLRQYSAFLRNGTVNLPEVFPSTGFILPAYPKH
ncbi:MAG: hypothetical protein ACLSUW_03810 [Akkermansia sp.]